MRYGKTKDAPNPFQRVFLGHPWLVGIYFATVMLVVLIGPMALLMYLSTDVGAWPPLLLASVLFLGCALVMTAISVKKFTRSELENSQTAYLWWPGQEPGSAKERLAVVSDRSFWFSTLAIGGPLSLLFGISSGLATAADWLVLVGIWCFASAVSMFGARGRQVGEHAARRQ